jgi:hypothetical protein
MGVDFDGTIIGRGTRDDVAFAPGAGFLPQPLIARLFHVIDSQDFHLIIFKIALSVDMLSLGFDSNPIDLNSILSRRFMKAILVPSWD